MTAEEQHCDGKTFKYYCKVMRSTEKERVYIFGKIRVTMRMQYFPTQVNHWNLGITYSGNQEPSDPDYRLGSGSIMSTAESNRTFCLVFFVPVLSIIGILGG